MTKTARLILISASISFAAPALAQDGPVHRCKKGFMLPEGTTKCVKIEKK